MQVILQISVQGYCETWAVQGLAWFLQWLYIPRHVSEWRTADVCEWAPLWRTSPPSLVHERSTSCQAASDWNGSNHLYYPTEPQLALVQSSLRLVWCSSTLPLRQSTTNPMRERKWRRIYSLIKSVNKMSYIIIQSCQTETKKQTYYHFIITKNVEHQYAIQEMKYLWFCLSSSLNECFQNHLFNCSPLNYYQKLCLFHSLWPYCCPSCCIGPWYQKSQNWFLRDEN